MAQTFCGYIAMVGRPNVGKSTLLNAIIDQPISITSKKPQTTRHNILGVHTFQAHQYVFIDTPGLHQKQHKQLNTYMNRQATSALHDVDCVLWVVDATAMTDEDGWVLDKLKLLGLPILLVLNKIDLLKQDDELLPIIEQLRHQHDFQHIVPVSAVKKRHLSRLLTTLQPYLPAGPHLFYPEQHTDRPIQFLLGEFIREQLFRQLGQELPYGATVYTESIEHKSSVTVINALILVNSAAHKGMVIGKRGEKLKAIGQAARVRIEHYLGKKVLLKCWVKVKTGWLDDEQTMRQYGYHE